MAGQEELGLRKGFLILVTINHLAIFNRVKKPAAITLWNYCKVGSEVGDCRCRLQVCKIWLRRTSFLSIEGIQVSEAFCFS